MRKCKTVSFDLSDAFESDLMAYAEDQGKFSKYIKRLIQNDKMGHQRPAIIPDKMEVVDDPDDAIDSYF